MANEIAEKIYQHFIEGKLKPGEKIPSAKEMQKVLGISEEELEAALPLLVYEGHLDHLYDYTARDLVASTAGRLGVLGGILSLTKEAIKKGMTPGSKVLRYEISAAGKFLGEKLELAPDEKVIIVERLRTVDGEPVALETSNIPHKLMPDVTPDMFEATGSAASSFDLMDNKGIHLARAVDIVSAVPVEKREAELLGMVEGQPILQRDRHTWDDQGRLAKWSRAFFKAKSQYEMKLR
ncbi:MAG: GntR family transcriptional regulator [Anaerolineae bacterium]|nr:GntR family transcriptional regulator [Anaerolineae bacterium]